MKKSNFIIDYSSEQGKYYLYNTRIGSIVSVDLDKREQLLNILNNPEWYDKEKVCQILQDYGFIISKNMDEIQSVYGSKILRHYCKSNYLELTIMPTEKCNFRCIYCYENFEKGAMSDMTQEAIIKFVKRELTNKKGLSVSWFGGEPLLAMNVIETLSQTFISICQSMKKPYMASMTTNGYLLNRELFEKLLKLRVNHFQVTIDGDRETHDSQRILSGGSPTYDQILFNLNDIRCNARGRLWTISLRTNVTTKVIENMERFKKEIVDQFSQDKRFYIMIRKMWSNNTEEADQIVCSDIEFERFLARCEIGEHSLYQEYLFSHNMNFICYAAKPNALVIGADGMIYKCTLALYDEINQVGYIDEKGDVIIDEGKMSYWIAPRISDQKQCLSCPNYAACVSCGCPYKQNQKCDSETLHMLRVFIPQFFCLSQKAMDLSEWI